MAWLSEANNLRKASRPLSIIDENPDDFKGRKTKHFTNQRSIDEPTTIGSPRVNNDRPTRRKAVAPLQHPVNLLVPFVENADKQEAIITGSDESPTQHSGHCENILRNGNEIPSICVIDDVSEPKLDRCGNSLQDSGEYSIDREMDVRTCNDNQFSDAEGINNGNQYAIYESGGKSRYEENQRYNTDIRNHDQNGNMNFNIHTLNDSKNEISQTKSGDHIQNSGTEGFSHSENSDESLKRTFYLSNSSSSLNTDPDDEAALQNGRQRHGKGQVEALERRFLKGSSTTVDPEEIEWKNRVKKSRSFIKNHINSVRPIKRSTSATFSDTTQSQSDSDEHFSPGKGKDTGGPLRRTVSLQMDPDNNKNDYSKSRAFLSILNDNFDKGLSGSLQKRSNIRPFNAASKYFQNFPGNDQSNNQTFRRISSIDQSDFSQLKVTANQLHLQTRRPSVMAWKEKYMTNTYPRYFLDHRPETKETGAPDKLEWTDENVQRINQSLSMLRQELIELRLQDQSLARQFLRLRKTMNTLRLTLQCKDHKELLNEAEEDIEELRELSQLVDLPPELLSPVTSLQNIGITRMNLSSRRFSTC